MGSETRILYQSNFYTIIDFKCNCNLKGTSCVEYQPDFTMSYVRKGNFLFNVFRNSLDAYNGWILLNKPEHEHTVTHFDGLPDECTIFKFNKEFYETIKLDFENLQEKFFNNNDVHSVLIKADAEFEHMHYSILQTLRTKKISNMIIDSFVLEMLYSTLTALHDCEEPVTFSERFKRNHLTTIEKAKHFINEKFEEDISLFDVAENCFVSPFHFSRIFKTITSYSPYQYLLNVRLKKAEILLKTTDLPVTQICFKSGFQNLEHFSYAFKRKYQIAPSRLKK
ncbi:MAG: AraC family transcriptional regulator [Bacteroidota bacterium]